MRRVTLRELSQNRQSALNDIRQDELDCNGPMLDLRTWLEGHTRASPGRRLDAKMRASEEVLGTLSITGTALPHAAAPG